MEIQTTTTTMEIQTTKQSLETKYIDLLYGYVLVLFS
jgi:hypothetical protein